MLDQAYFTRHFALHGSAAECRLPRDPPAVLVAAGLPRWPPSYVATMAAIGGRKIRSTGYQLWISTPERNGPSPFHSIVASLEELRDHNAHWEAWNGGKRWTCIAEDDAPRHEFSIPRLIPIFANTEYDSWLCWNTEKISPTGEPELIYLDFGQQVLLGWFADLAEFLDYVVAGGFTDDIERDAQGRVVMRPIMEVS